MKKATENMAVKDFPIPDGVEFAKIDPKTGLLANSQTEKPFFEVFMVGTKPTESAPEVNHHKKPDDFMMLDAGHEEETEKPDNSILRKLFNLGN